jgi:hypothetical protein
MVYSLYWFTNGGAKKNRTTLITKVFRQILHLSALRQVVLNAADAKGMPKIQGDSKFYFDTPGWLCGKNGRCRPGRAGVEGVKFS